MAPPARTPTAEAAVGLYNLGKEVGEKRDVAEGVEVYAVIQASDVLLAAG